MAAEQVVEQQLAALAVHILHRREAVLKAWRQLVSDDPELQTPSSLSRSKFNDHIPGVLQAFAHKLEASPGAAAASAEQVKKSSAHGAHRWQEGYNLREVAREWKHLMLTLLDELESFAHAHCDLDPAVMPLARRSLAALCGDGVSQSVAEYARLQQATAAARVRDLEQAIEQVNALQRQRAEAWREAAHDLRNSVGMISSATTLLNRDGVSDGARAKSLSALQAGVTTLRDMLNDLLSVARLEAGQEQRRVAAFDAGQLLHSVCDSVRATARERGLFLREHGDANLPVEGDPVKTQRIAQNLLLNALESTKRGGVTVSWKQSDGNHWSVSIADTGPGVENGSGAPILQELKAITGADEPGSGNEPQIQAGSSSTRPIERSNAGVESYGHFHGEGIGLSIVKQLCDLLDATLDFESTPGEGSVFRVTFPSGYES